MGYKFEDELRVKAAEYIKTLLQAGVEVEPFPAMFRDYLVKITVGRAGYINIYYSDKSKSFSLKTHELRDKNIIPQVEACWNTLVQSSDEVYSSLYQAYVDGSFLEGFVGYGAVILKNGQPVEQFSGSVDQHTEQRQVVGELQATISVLQWCQENEIEEIEVFYDYEGIEKWATGEWRANNEATYSYAMHVRESLTKVIWHKVKSHTRVHWNEVVDELAKQGALSNVKQGETKLENPLEVLEQKATDFVNYLTSHGIQAEFKQICNGQYARIVIGGGYFDLYNTPKRPMLPYIHTFKDASLQAQVQELWIEFQQGASKVETPRQTSKYEEVEHYLRVFEPYRHLPFDFTKLALALKKVAGDTFDVMAYRDDFNELKNIYDRIRGGA